jgi:hypothetical protein
MGSDTARAFGTPPSAACATCAHVCVRVCQHCVFACPCVGVHICDMRALVYVCMHACVCCMYGAYVCFAEPLARLGYRITRTPHYGAPCACTQANLQTCTRLHNLVRVLMKSTPQQRTHTQARMHKRKQKYAATHLHEPYHTFQCCQLLLHARHVRYTSWPLGTQLCIVSVCACVCARTRICLCKIVCVFV